MENTTWLTMWYVRFDNGKWDVEKYDDFRKHIWFEEDSEESRGELHITASTGDGGIIITGLVLASCENSAVVIACHMLRDMYSVANSAPLPM